MTSVKFSYRLSLPLKLEMFNYTKPYIEYTKTGHLVHKALHPNMLPQELHQFLTELDACVTHGELFYTPPHVDQEIHLDTGDYGVFSVGGESHMRKRRGELLKRIAKLNWCYDEQGDTSFNDVPSMSWWNVKEESPSKIYDKKACELLSSDVIYQPSLVRIDVPHNAFNTTDRGRWAISLSLGDHKKEALSWEHAVQMFAPYSE